MSSSNNSNHNSPPVPPSQPQRVPTLRLNLSAATLAAAAVASAIEDQNPPIPAAPSIPPPVVPPSKKAKTVPTISLHHNSSNNTHRTHCEEDNTDRTVVSVSSATPTTSTSTSATATAAENDERIPIIPTTIHQPHPHPPHYPRNTASVAHVTVLHQSTRLHLAFLDTPTQNGGGGGWHMEGTTRLYLINRNENSAPCPLSCKVHTINDDADATTTTTTTTTQANHHHNKNESSSATTTLASSSSSSLLLSAQLALHLRQSCAIQSLRIDALESSRHCNKLVPRDAEYEHVDPLHHVMVRSTPASASFSSFSHGKKRRRRRRSDSGDSGTVDADAHSSRGATGMTNALRAASIASNLGEVRIRYHPPPIPPTTIPPTPSGGTNNNDCRNSSRTKNGVQVESTNATISQESSHSETSKVTTLTGGEPNKTIITTATSTARTNPTSIPTNSRSSLANTKLAEAVWKHDLQQQQQQQPQQRKDASTISQGQGQSQRNRQRIRHRHRQRQRIDYVAQQLAAAGQCAVKVTIVYRIHIPQLMISSSLSLSSSSTTRIARQQWDCGGLHLRHADSPPRLPTRTSHSPHSHASTVWASRFPVLYTTAGVLGDHEGPRCWVPCIDSASTSHRSTHQFQLFVTAPMTAGLLPVASGEHEPNDQDEDDEEGNTTTTTTYLHLPVSSSLISREESSGSISSSPNALDDASVVKLNTSRVIEEEDNDNDPDDTRMDIEENEAHDSSPAKVDAVDAAPSRHHATSTSTSRTTTTTPIQQEEALNIRRVLTHEHVDFLHRAETTEASSSATTAIRQSSEPWMTTTTRNHPSSTAMTTTISTPHIIPQDTWTLDSILATVLYENAIWSPIPIRSLGFCVGPFDVVEDAEYFSATRDTTNGDDDDDEAGNANPFEAARHGGIRNYYIAPIYQRKFTHLHADTSLLPPVTLCPLPLSSHQMDLSAQHRDAVQRGTMGVPLRALNLMRNILAVPTFRTWSHIQVWIPGCVHGGITCGSLQYCPEVSINGFLGLSILDSRLLPPPRSRLAFGLGGRVLQFAQARAAIRGWLVAAVPLGGNDDVGNGYIHSVIESLLMSLYERSHGAHGEGGGKHGMFFSNRYSETSGMNSSNLDFLPVQNIEPVVNFVGGVAAVPVEERNNEQLWRSASNGSESHTSALDDSNIRQLLCRDAVEALERVSDKENNVPLPSLGWFGSYLSLTLLSSNASSSSDLGCGAVDLLHPVGGLVYRSLKTEVFRLIVEGRAGVSNFIRLIRAAFLAAHLGDSGESELVLPMRRDKKSDTGVTKAQSESGEIALLQSPYVVCVNEILKKKGLTHTLFTRALQNLSGPMKDTHLLGTLVDVEANESDPRTLGPLVEPEGFPNSYVRGSSLLYCRVGVQVELGDSGAQSGVAKGVSMVAYAEPIIPEGGIAYGGPITMRVIENEGQFREYTKELKADGSRRDWGSTFLHAKPVSTVKAQNAASGLIEAPKDAVKPQGQVADVSFPSLQSKSSTRAFSDTNFHYGGYQAIEMIRLTNLTPLLWVRVDPLGLYGGRISVFQPDCCLAECLFHDGDASAQVDAIRALAERPLRIQAPAKVSTIHDVKVSELPLRILADCLRGSPALHSSLPHTPAVRCQAALAIAQWQNNKAPLTKDTVGLESWIGANLLIQYFRERFYSNGVVMPVKFTRLALKKDEAEVESAAATVTNEPGAANPRYDDNYEYLDSLEEGEERAEKAAAAGSIEMEEDEEYRVRSAVVTAISSIRAKDGQTPIFVLQFLENILEAEDAESVSHLVYPDEELMIEKSFQRMKARASDSDLDSDGEEEAQAEENTPALSYESGKLLAEALFALCNLNVWPTMLLDPASGKSMQVSSQHPVTRLINLARSWLDWELYREKIRLELSCETCSGLSGNCHELTAAAAILALSMLSIMRLSTSDPPHEENSDSMTPSQTVLLIGEEVTTVQFYTAIFDEKPTRNDITRAACAQAMACICCAADRFQETSKAVGLLTALEFLLDRILDANTSQCLRHTLSLIMMDACSGKVCSTQRVGAIAGQNDLIASAARFLTGPLGASHGGDNGSAIVTTVSAATFPAAHSVNEGARRGRRLVGRAGHPKESNVDRLTIVRTARFATRLWRTINGDVPEPLVMDCDTSNTASADEIIRIIPGGVCAYDGALRCSLLALWQLLWPRGCFSVLQVQDWKSQEHTPLYDQLGAAHVMQISDEEKTAAAAEDLSLLELNRFVNKELERQCWRGSMAKTAYELYKSNKMFSSSASSTSAPILTTSASLSDLAAAEQGIGQPLPPIQRDAAFKQGGWIASAAQQRRALALDGGIAVTKVRLTVKNSSIES